jgi:hypothetical protein
MADGLCDAFYRVAFGSGALLQPGGLVVRGGKVGGMGNNGGIYTGTAFCENSSRVLTLDIGVRVAAGTPIASGLKAGPAGSTVYFKAQGAPPEPEMTYKIDLAGNKGEMTLSLLDELATGTTKDGDAAVPHPDAFPDGIYLMESAGASYLTRTVVVFNAGQLLGIGEMGGQYRGSYVFDPVRKLTSFTGTGALPPGVLIATGAVVGREWLTVPLLSEAKFNKGKTRLSFAIFGRAMDAELTYQQPLPA